MKIQVNLNSIGKKLSDLIKEKLEQVPLPDCLGNMCPPIIDAIVCMDTNDVFTFSGGVPEENIVKSDITCLIPMDRTKKTKELFSQFVLDVNGLMKLEALKNDMVTRYVEKLERCSKPCPHLELCDKLTRHYINTIKGGR